MLVRCTFLSTLVLGLVGILLVTSPFAADTNDHQAKTRFEAAQPWLMVTMGASPHSGGGHVFSVLKQLSGSPNGKIVHFSQVTYELIVETQPAFIVLGPQGTPWCRYTGETGIALQNFLWMLPSVAEELNIPILGICGGHQALALAFGGKVGPIRADEDDCMPYTHDRQGGVVALNLKAPDPIFSGIEGSLRILESHYDEVKVLPPGFVLLASEKVSRNQIIRHPTRPVYGVQGHPERFYSGRPDGGVLIRNFLTIARTHNQMLRQASPDVSGPVLSLNLPDQPR
jgi:GMP synthase (glutamine-hydrolysing)